MKQQKECEAMVAPAYANARTAAFRATLDRLPDEIALAIGLRVFDEDTLSSPSSCVCGWALRESIARAGDLPCIPRNARRSRNAKRR